MFEGESSPGAVGPGASVGGRSEAAGAVAGTGSRTEEPSRPVCGTGQSNVVCHHLLNIGHAPMYFWCLVLNLRGVQWPSICMLDYQVRGPWFKPQHWQKFGSKFLLHTHP